MKTLYENRGFAVEQHGGETAIMFSDEYPAYVDEVLSLAFWLVAKGHQSGLQQEMAEALASISDADLREVGQRIHHQLVLRRMCPAGNYGGTG